MLRLFFHIILFLSFHLTVYSQNNWGKLNGPLGCAGRSIIKGPDEKIILGTLDGRIFYTNDNGENWQRSQDVFQMIFFVGIVDFVYCNDGSVLAGIPNIKGVWRSTNDGKNWILSGIVDEKVMTLSKDLDGNIYAGTRTHTHIWKSTNNGSNWILVNTTVTVGEINDIVFNPVTNSLFAGTSNYILRSTDFGNSWEHLINGMGSAAEILELTVDMAGNTFAGSVEQGGAIYLSTDNGDNWINNDTNQTFGDIINVGINKMLAVEDYLFVATGSGVAKSIDMGKNWRFITNGFTSPRTMGLAYDSSPNTIYSVNQNSGVFISTDFGESWSLKSNGLNASVTAQICFDKDETLYAASYLNGVHRSTNNGDSWDLTVNGIANFRTRSIYWTKDGYLILGTEDGYYYSTDRGNNWYHGIYFLRKTIHKIIEDHKGNWYFATWGGSMVRSTNKGQTWAEAITEFVVSLAVDSSGNLYAGTNSGRIYKSSDSGEVWFFSDIGLPTGSTIMDIEVSPSGGKILAGTYCHGLFVSLNQGQSWEDISFGGLEQKAVYSIGLRSDEEIFTSIYNDDEIYYTSTGGGNWLSCNNEMNMIETNDFIVDKEGYVFAATQEGVWKTISDTFTVVVNAEEQIVKEFSLTQNFPNPFNPITTIEFTITVHSEVSLEIYDILGRKIKTLIEGNLSEGIHNVKFDATGFKSGIYIYVLRSAKHTLAKKMILLR